MELESLPSQDHTDPAAPGLSSEPASYRDAQVWKYIKAETGFASYADYLKFYLDVDDKRAELLRYEGLPEDETYLSAHERSRIVVYDLSILENSLTRLSQRCVCDSGTKLIEALRKPPDGVCVQLVLWFNYDFSLNQEMVDTLVLGLKLNIEDFRSRRLWPSAPKTFGPQIKSVFGEQTVATIAQNFMPNAKVPVVLVASTAWSDHWTLLDLILETHQLLTRIESLNPLSREAMVFYKRNAKCMPGLLSTSSCKVKTCKIQSCT